MVRRADITEVDIQEMILRLRQARTEPNVRLLFKDGRNMNGAITFVERLGTGRLINVDDEFAADFNIYELKQVDF
ncbi:MAG: hypothetical protein ISR76_02665 [Planctomycetes bacterium]|nr:hypothetical protein [Planctomycetota bacterium]